MTTPTEHHIAVADGASLAVVEATGRTDVFQFGQRVWLVDFAVEHLRDPAHAVDRLWHAQNAVLAAYAALEAMVLESAFELHPTLYEKKAWRGKGLRKKLECYLVQEDRSDSLPAIVDVVAECRIAMTHAEPDKSRSATYGAFLASDGPARLSQDVRDVGNWLWRGTLPSVAAKWWPQWRPAGS